MAKTLITGGIVRALDGAPEPLEALVIEDGKILALGPAREMEDVAGRGAERVDVEGATVMPGLVDTHPHVLHHGARAAGLVDLADVRNHEDIVARIRAHAERAPAGEWIMCTPVGEPHYFIRRSFRDLDERRLPDRHTLDRAAPEHPVMIQAWAPKMPNAVAFNSAGLRALGLTSFIPDQVCDVSIEKDENGELTGVLRGPVNNYYTYDPFWGQLLTKLPPFQPERVVEGTLAEMARYTRHGVTTVYESHAMEPEHIEVYRHLRAQDLLTFRVMATWDVESTILFPFDPLPLDGFMARLDDLARRPAELTDDLLRVNGITMSPGGPCFSGYFATYDPYPDPFGRPTRGVRFLSLEKEEAFTEYCAQHEVRANMCLGAFREHDEFLEIADRVVRQHDFRDQRWILQHAITITPDQVRRYKELGFQLTTSVGFSWGKGDVYGERMGKHVWADLLPLRRLLDAGLDVAGCSDWGPKNPWEQIKLAQTHEFAGSGHRNDGPDQALTREQAVAMWTTQAARVLGWEGIGTLAPGMHADLIVVDRDPLVCDVDELPGTTVLRTTLGGAVVHDSGELKPPRTDPAVESAGAARDANPAI